jgi:hypothetical protein
MPWPSGRTAVAAQQPAKSLVGDHLTITTRRLLPTIPDAPVAEPLVRSLFVVVLDELSNRAPQMILAEQDQLAQALPLDRSHKSLGDRVHVRRLERRRHHAYAGLVEDTPELLGELRVAIEDQPLRIA